MPPWDIENVVWQDKELRFDSVPGLMECRKGEVVIDSINSVEDTKGNNGERGDATLLLYQYSVNSTHTYTYQYPNEYVHPAVLPTQTRQIATCL